MELGKLGSKVNLTRSGGADGGNYSRSGRGRVVWLWAVLDLRFGGHLDELWPERGRWGQSSRCCDLDWAGSDSNGLSLVSGSPRRLWALNHSLSDMLQGFLFNFVFISVLEVVLEEGRRGSWGRWPGSRDWSSGVVGFGVISLSRVGGCGLLFFFIRFVGVARVARDVGELSFVAIGVDVSVFAAYNAVGASGFFFEGSISSFVAEGETTIIVNLEEI